MWGERGIIASFFADMNLWGRERDWAALLSAVDIAAPNFPRMIDDVTVMVEPDFGNLGFGHPDAVMVVRNGGDAFVIILEAKRQAFVSCCRKRRGDQGYNSTLKGQLELNHMLALAVSEFRTGQVLREPEWVCNTPYATGRLQGVRAALKNPIVLNNLIKPISGLAQEQYFHVILTTDEVNPFTIAANAQSCPELYTATHQECNCWPHLKTRFGWLNYSKLCAVADRLDRAIMPNNDGLFGPSFEVNRANLRSRVLQNIGDIRSKKSILVFVPEVNPNTFLHCSIQGQSCKLRDYSSGADDPRVKEGFTADKILSLAKQLLPAPRESITNHVFWHREIERTNAKYLPLPDKE